MVPSSPQFHWGEAGHGSVPGREIKARSEAAPLQDGLVWGEGFASDSPKRELTGVARGNVRPYASLLLGGTEGNGIGWYSVSAQKLIRMLRPCLERESSGAQ